MTYSTEMQIIISLEMFKGRKENQISQIHLIFAHLNECVGQSSLLFFSYSRPSLFTLLTFVQLEWIECSLVLKHLSVWDLEPCFLGVPFREGRGSTESRQLYSWQWWQKCLLPSGFFVSVLLGVNSGGSRVYFTSGISFTVLNTFLLLWKLVECSE